MAGKTTEEIFGNRLDSAVIFKAATMQSVVLINNRLNGYSVIPLPMQMQLAPIFSFYQDDFNKDRKKDLLTGGNFYDVLPFEGRYDAMPLTVGLGNNNGIFTCKIPYNEPIISGEIRDIEPINIAGKKCIIIARHNDTLKILSY
jgi:hypothetical protein